MCFNVAVFRVEVINAPWLASFKIDGNCVTASFCQSSFESAGLLNVVTATVAANFQIAHVVLQCFTLSGSLLGKVCEFYGSALNLTILQRILHSVIFSL